MQDLVSLSDLCKALSISYATGKNWVKLGKIIPEDLVNKVPFFTAEYLEKLKSDIGNGKNSALKSRRNKKYVSGNNIYNSYVSEKSKNLFFVKSLIEYIELNNIEITNDVLIALLAECSVRLIYGKKFGLTEYLKSLFEENEYSYLIDDLLALSDSVSSVIESNPLLFKYDYVYEEKEDILGLLYISLKNIGSRKATGSYYTPNSVVLKLCGKLFSMNESENKTVFDPCCGTGNFILQLPNNIDYHNIFGNDIDAISVRIARINFALKYSVSDKNIVYSHITQNDYLIFGNDIKYDFIIGNPPWGFDFSEEYKSKLRIRYNSAVGKSVESYDVFVEKALSDLKENGILSFVLPEAFLNVKNHTPIRNILMKENSFQYLEFLGNAFDKVQCPCIIMQAVHNNKPFSSKGMTVKDSQREFTINSDRKVSAECFSFLITDHEYSIMNKIESLPNKVTLKGKAVFALGIVTGNNKEYISKEKNPENEMILKGSDILKFTFRNTDNYITFRPESFQQSAPIEYYRAKEKLLYRFICNQLVFAYDNQQTLSLNSCNILIPKIEDLDIKYIMSILNSRIAQFYFRKKFNSVKVLRLHIEQISIPRIAKETQERIIDLADSVSSASDESKIVIYEKLDTEISKLYRLTDDEYNIIKNCMKDENLFLH